MLKDEIVDYVKRYADSFNPPFTGNVEVYQVFRKTKDGDFYITNSIGNFTAGKLIIATGAYHIPNVLPISKDFDNSVKQLHSVDYKNPEQLEKGATLIKR